MIKNLRSQNIGVLVTDHDVREIIKIVDRVYIISEGETISRGDTTESCS
jgi:lipopolysaccharide export system ATP-binding protein